MTNPNNIILAYSDILSAYPGDSVSFKVHCEIPQQCSYNIVRLICGDASTAGPGLKYKKIKTIPPGKFFGRRQEIACGSFVSVPFKSALAWQDGVNFEAYIWPTRVGGRVQTIFSHLDPDGKGVELSLDEMARPLFCVRDGTGKKVNLVLDEPLRNHEWINIHCTYDTQSGRMYLKTRNMDRRSTPGNRIQVKEKTGVIGLTGPHHPLLISACLSSRGPCQHFDGKIDGPSLRSHTKYIAKWNFAKDIGSVQITDISGNDLHGKTENLPTRGVTGHNWDGTIMDWRFALDQYDAIHFHHDDIYDAKWETDFKLTVPEGISSGVYGAWITGEDDTEHVQPFVIKSNRSSAKVVLLLPTMSYMAYANESLHLYTDAFERFVGRIPVLDDVELFMAEHPEYGMSLYDSHADGSGVCHASRMRPMTNMRFGRQVNYMDNEDAGLWQFNADLHITDWLEEKQISYDVITDEDLHNEGIGLLNQWPVLVTGTHPEYWSNQMLTTLRDYLDQGSRLMYLGGNGFYERCEYHPKLPGVIETRRTSGMQAWKTLPGEAYHSFVPGHGGPWRDLGQSPQNLVGVGSTAVGHEYSIGYDRLNDSFNLRVNFIFKGIDKAEKIGDFGSRGGGAAGIETDRFDLALGSPSHTLYLATAKDFGDEYLLFSDDILFTSRGITGSQNDLVRADMTFFETESGGAVFSVGSIAWTGSLAHNNYSNNVSQITGNVLKRFIDPEPFEIPKQKKV